MTYLVNATTDHKYVGIRIKLEKLPMIGDTFILKDIELKVVDITKDANIIKVFSYNYIVELKEEN